MLVTKIGTRIYPHFGNIGFASAGHLGKQGLLGKSNPVAELALYRIEQLFSSNAAILA